MNKILNILILVISINLNAQINKSKPLMFNIHKTLVNIEKISTQNLQVSLNCNIIEKVDSNYYWVKDNSGKMKVIILPKLISNITNYNINDVFNIIVKVKDVNNNIFIVDEIKINN